MKRNFLVFVLSLLLVVPCTILFTACEQPPELIELEDHMLSVEYLGTFYDGTEKEPTVTVTVEEVVIPESAYSVNYENNTNAGTATILVKATNNNEFIKGSASTTFEILKIRKNVQTFEDLKASLVNLNVSSVNLLNDIEVPTGETLTIDNVLDLNGYNLENNGTIVNNGKIICDATNFLNNGTLTNNAKILVDVDSVAGLKAAYEFADEINITDDIKTEDSTYLGDITLKATSRNYDLVINLNNHTIEAELDFINYVSGSISKNNVVYSDYGINIKINNGKIGGELNDAGILIKGNEKINVELSNCALIGTDAGLLTNGNCKGATITALNCTFTGTNLDDVNHGQKDGASGAYLPSQDVFNFTACTFTGLTGYYSKSGTHNLLSCTFNANAKTYAEPKHNGNGCSETGSALVIDSAANYQSPLVMNITGGYCTSAAAYGIEVYTTGNTNPYSTINITGSINYDVELENTRYWYDTWTGNVTEISTEDAVENIITIKTAAELAGLAKAVNSGVTFEGYTIKLASDIDLANIEFTPIGYGNTNYVGKVLSGNHFSGIFDGQDHTIHNLKITTFNKGGITDEEKSTGIALFGSTFGAEIKNIKVNTANIVSNHYAGVIAGHALNTDITNCHVINAIVDCQFANTDEEAGDKAGAIVGHFAKGTKQGSAAALTNCSASNSVVKADRDAGQLIGCLSNKATQENNTVANVTVEWNESSTGKVDESYTKENTNIKEDLVGRVA